MYPGLVIVLHDKNHSDCGCYLAFIARKNKQVSELNHLILEHLHGRNIFFAGK